MNMDRAEELSERSTAHIYPIEKIVREKTQISLIIFEILGYIR